jgi:hypothetical protein
MGAIQGWIALFSKSIDLLFLFRTIPPDWVVRMPIQKATFDYA